MIFTLKVYATSVSKDEALSIAKLQFKGQDVDYFILDATTPIWTIFVDAEPMKGWKHDCYSIRIPKETKEPIDSITPVIVKMQIPPTGNYIPLSVKNRYGSNANSKPSVKKRTASNSTNNNTVAQRTYAIILSGGVNKLSNHERYWNDCSFIYQTLVNKYDIPKDNVYPIMSDGTSADADMRLTSGAIISQPLDLDFDGEDDIKYAATKANIKSVLSSLSEKLGKDDHLLFFVIDHGGTTDYDNDSYICLWGNDKLYDYELATMLKPLSDNYVNINVVLGQCFAGGFIDDLQSLNCVVSAASLGNEYSYSCSDIPYDEFVYQWTSAINEATHDQISVEADSDGNGNVTMDEAFSYAKSNDRIEDEHPQFSSTPLSIGEDLAFNNLAPSLDIYIKDNPEDTGKEPNTTTTEFWKSPSICIRNEPDSIFVHENPEYSSDHNVAYVYAKIHNRGKEPYTGGKWLQIYWAQASTGLTAKAWRGREVYNNTNVTGGPMEVASIPPINPGDSVIIQVDWLLPSLLKSYPDGNFHFCLLAKILDYPYDETYVEGKTSFKVKGSNDQVQKNVTIIRKADLSKNFNVYVRNTTSETKEYSLELVPCTDLDKKLYSIADVQLEMSPRIYSAWERGGLKYNDISFPDDDSNAVLRRTVKLLTPNSKLDAIRLNGDEFDTVSLNFTFKNIPRGSNTYAFDLIQRDSSTGEIVGGETFLIESPSYSPVQLEIKVESQPDGNLSLITESSDFKSIDWYNDNTGDSLGSSDSITVSPSVNESYTAVATTEEGDIATDSVSLNDYIGIKSISLDTTTSQLIVELNLHATEDSRCVLSNIVDGSTITFVSVPVGENSCSLNISNLTSGIYALTYISNGQVTDSRKITIK
jgi:hypothetical protein